jgi:hypothetical protein
MLGLVTLLPGSDRRRLPRALGRQLSLDLITVQETLANARWDSETRMARRGSSHSAALAFALNRILRHARFVVRSEWRCSAARITFMINRLGI